jgi:UDP-GlcNAc:undecaprenyl-phosphate GlcNAc-1-phosphate transferase
MTKPPGNDGKPLRDPGETMTESALLTHLAFSLALALLSAAAVWGMIQLRLLDHPDHRKQHNQPTPKGGGVGVVLAYLVGIALLYHYAAFGRLADPYFRGMILASLAVALVSLLDDLRDWPFTVKLAAQLLVAFSAIGSGLYIDALNLPMLGTVQLGWVGAGLTLVWIIFAPNAMNFIDGMNGLAAGVSLIACAFLAAIAAGQGGWFVYFAALILAAGLAGFLPFNYPRARIFMGDVGSQFCGFTLAMLAVASSRFERVEMSFVLVPFLLSGVLFDVAFTLVRRAVQGEKVHQAHCGHLYQVAQRAGMNPVWITAVHWGFAAYGGVGCLLFIAAPPAIKPLVLLLPVPVQLGWAAYVVRRARHAGLRRW